ncbi:MAG: hypothetical protein AB1586_22945 [Pseudomonadota bacterium]
MITIQNRLLETLVLGLSCLLAVTVLVRARDITGDDAMPRAAIQAPSAPTPVRRAEPAPPTSEEIRQILQDMALHD